MMVLDGVKLEGIPPGLQDKSGESDLKILSLTEKRFLVVI